MQHPWSTKPTPQLFATFVVLVLVIAALKVYPTMWQGDLPVLPVLTWIPLIALARTVDDLGYKAPVFMELQMYDLTWVYAWSSTLLEIHMPYPPKLQPQPIWMLPAQRHRTSSLLICRWMFYGTFSVYFPWTSLSTRWHGSAMTGKWRL